ncbi:cation:proton antiporter [Microbacterium terricola]|uniref:Sodium/hydrogen exchanger n=1 Tax=Microbacterium terricola TaxID=344163 RepID=A0ABM8DXJ0_9MICO|nr:cation:proton antiporter [Microbacterium terricola]UYK38956.1 cation:proton antiporter [Microbacterium terricola]BDV30344.1 sodium/hydrogen exchanger [Microbacterium terricola]
MDLDVSLFVIPLLAVAAPLLGRLVGRWVRIPIVVFELLLGILVGPSVLAIVAPTEFIDVLSEFGLALLFFVAGTEIEASALRGRTGRRAWFGWVVSFCAGTALGWIIAPGIGAVVIGIALSSTALGTLLPIMRDANELSTPFGRSVMALGAVGEFGPLIAISILLGGRSPGAATVVLLLFAVIAVAAIMLALRMPQGRLHEFVNSTLHTSGQFAIRVVFAIVASLVFLSLVMGIDMLLGAFTAGIVWRLIMRDATEHDRHAVESKIEGVAFGFLVPIFFIYTGVTFDLAALLADPLLLALVVAALIVLLAVRGGPSVLAAPVGAGARERAAVMLMGATGLPIIVAVTSIGVDEQMMTSAQAAVLVGAGMLSVLLFPLIAMTLRGDSTKAPAQLRDDGA